MLFIAILKNSFFAQAAESFDIWVSAAYMDILLFLRITIGMKVMGGGAA